MDDVSVALEHVDLLNGLNWLDIELLQRSLQLLIIRARALVDLLDFPARRTFAADTNRRLHPRELGLIHICGLEGIG
jgi:hypothetical protein